MAGKNAAITVRILGDAKGAEDAAKDVEQVYGGLGKKMSGFAAGIGAAIGTFAVDMGKNLVAAAGDWVNLAKEADIFSKKADIVFGDSAASVKEWADGINESLGLSDEVVVGLTASMGDLLVPLGFTREEAAKMSQGAIELSGALSAWSGGTVDAAAVSEILTKAMLGETDGLKQLGISISADEVARKMATLAAEGQTFATEAQAKAAATQALIMEKSTDAQTAWADGSMDAVKAANENKAGMADLTTMIGQQLLPVVEKITEWMGIVLPVAFEAAEVIIGAVKDAIGFLSDNSEYVIPILGAFAVAVAVGLVPAFIAWAATAGAAAIATVAAAAPVIALGTVLAALVAGVIYAYNNFEVFRAIVDGVATVLKTIVTVAFEAVTTAATWLWKNVLSPLADFLIGVFKVHIEAIKLAFDVLTTAIDGVVEGATWLWKNVLKPLADFLTGAFETAWDVAADAIGYVSAPFEKLLGWTQSIISKAQTAIGLVQDLLGGGVSGTLNLSGLPGGKPSGGDKVPGFATGGVVPGAIGAPMLAVVHGGEEVLTPEQRRSGTVNFMPGAVIHQGIDLDAAFSLLNFHLAAS